MGHDQTWFLTDRCSTGGTFLWNIDKWDPIKQEFVCSGDWLKFGEFKCRVDVLLRHLPREGETVSGPRGGKSGTEAPILDDRPQGPVRRDPMTGDVIAAEDQK